ncbi:hypothetical protein [Sphingosinicella sp. CPCC 101087]|uniref:hypothetical protein n=1 Tax=Sphingosinicella sp. CPCC 101087 TaxID=2497754 RepID=UPI001980F546|nr:hypothetical protein [Sphingosinicella sp. CPCC 101087]
MLLLGALFGPPLAGAASTLFWTTAADGNTASSVAVRIYDRVYSLPVGLSFISDKERLPDVSLGVSCHERYLNGIRAGDEGTNLLWEAIRRHSNKRLHNLLKFEPAYEALLSLPPPALGALDACIGGSPLIGMACESYAKRITEEAQAEAAQRRTDFSNLAKLESEAIWCAAASPNMSTKG